MIYSVGYVASTPDKQSQMFDFTKEGELEKFCDIYNMQIAPKTLKNKLDNRKDLNLVSASQEAIDMSNNTRNSYGPKVRVQVSYPERDELYIEWQTTKLSTGVLTTI